MAANAVTDTNSNPISIPINGRLTVSSVSLTIAGKTSHKVFLIGHFSANFTGAKDGAVVAEVSEDGNTMMSTELDYQTGVVGTLVSLSGILTVKPGKHVFELKAYAEKATSVAAHHRSLTAIDLR